MMAEDEIAKHPSAASGPPVAVTGAPPPITQAVGAVAAAVPPAPPISGETTPSLPVSMLLRPATLANGVTTAPHFPRESELGFAAALAAVEPMSRTSGISALIRRLRTRLGRPEAPLRSRRVVAFDGFRGSLHTDKLERDRRYGTVYSVREEANAYLVRLEMPRRLPESALKAVWQMPDEMPDYNYAIRLDDHSLTIRAAAPSEAIRRLAYVSASFPPDFMTRIDFSQPVESFAHSLRDKVLEVVVFKAEAQRRAGQS